MIEHITSDGGSHPDHYDLMAKINELVDAVNLTTHNPQPNPQPENSSQKCVVES